MIARGFFEFLKEYKVVSLAVAFVMGAATTSLVNSLVKDVVMPIVAPLLSSGALREATFSVGPVVIAYGSFLAETVNFVILAGIVYVVVKKLIKEDAADIK